ncbi:Quinol monooxygenase YgiN [Tenacibaculum sp. MAR_2009_124]|uniref:putative quinol monooxygenase n=1 Tax=Tenacibaculum sp. MAR_2009_124 TaxID=1250059 RepID=UPI000895F5FA|nr:putative quinol monooxygenase [Tenacibaculum sp. MAR_2009_124]SEB53028.1 Quinol monooxygenase YgiN [Tenacibaculum sp. MAR_2009_124]
MKKTLIAQIQVKANDIEIFIELAKQMVKTSNNEEGCITYELFNHIDSKDKFLFFEEYSNEDALNYHNTSDHFHQFLNDITHKLVKEPIITKY